MALKAVNLTIGQAKADGKTGASVKNASLPAPTLTTLLAAITTALTDITAALGTAASNHDSTTEITLVQTDVTAVQTAANALVLAMQSDVAVLWDTTTITHRQQLQAALARTLHAVEQGIGGLAV